MGFNNITKECRSMAIAMSIGDGCILKSGCLQFKHCENQLDYLKWKINRLTELGMEFNPIYKEESNTFGKHHIAYRCRSKKYPFLTKYRQILYTPTKNIYKQSVLKHLNPEHLAIWFMDDGSLLHSRGITPFCYMYTFTNKITCDRLISYFKETWDIEFIPFQKKNSCQKFISDEVYNTECNYCLRANTKSTRKFISIIKPYVENVPGMEYKVKLLK